MTFRVRTRSDPPVIENYSQTNVSYAGTCSNPEAQTSGTVTYPMTTYSYVEQMEDIVTPGYRGLSKQGKIINSPMRKTSTKSIVTLVPIESDSAYWGQINCPPLRQVLSGSSTSGVTGVAGTLSLGTPDVIDVQRLRDIAVAGAWAKASQSEAAVLATLGEAKQSITGMIKIFRRLIRLIINYKKVDFWVKYLTPEALADWYMEWRYAIRPLIYDAKNILNAINHMKPTHDRQTFRGFAEESRTKYNTVYNTSWYSVFKYNTAQVAYKKVTARAGVLCQVSPPNKLEVWGLYDVAESFWELVPFSFIIDWFFNVGTTIASWTPSASLKPLSSWVVVQTDTILTSELSSINVFPVAGRNYRNLHCNCSGAKRIVHTIEKTRSPDPQRAVLPSFNLRLDALKLLDLVIIARKLWQK